MGGVSTHFFWWGRRCSWQSTNVFLKSLLNRHPESPSRGCSAHLHVPGLSETLLISLHEEDDAAAEAEAEPDQDDPRLHAVGRQEEREILPLEGKEVRG